jgi:hypothetical protein
MSEGIPMQADGKTPATEDQIETQESKILKFEKREYLARHILMYTTSTCFRDKLKNLLTPKDM